MRSFVPVLCVLAFFAGLAGLAQDSGARAVDLPVRSVDLPTRPVSFPEPAVDPLPFVTEDEVCVDGSCSPVAAASGPVASVAQVVTGPVRRIIERKPVRRVVGRVFSRLRGCR